MNRLGRLFLVVGFHRLFHLGAYTKVCMQGASQEQCVVLFGFFTVRDDFLSQLRPYVILWKGRQGEIRFGAFGELFFLFGVIGKLIFHLIVSRARV